MATYRDKVIRERGEMTRAERCEKTKARNANRQKVRRDNAGVLIDSRLSRGTAEQIAVLDGRLGKGIGAKKERARLTKG